MTDEEREEERTEEQGAEVEAAHAPPVPGDPEENPEDLEEHLEETWEEPASEEEKSPVETAEPLEAEGEAFEPPEEEAETEREAVEEAVEETGTGVVEEDEEPAVAEMATEEAKAEIEHAEEIEEALAEEDSTPAAEEAEAVAAEEAKAVAEMEGEQEPEGSLEAQLEEAQEEAEEEDDDRAWYVIHCYSGQENKVSHNLEQRIETMGMKDRIFDVVVPTEEEIEVKDGKRRTVERRVFPGYILVQMILTEDSWYVVRNTPGVTGFVGMGNEPTPLRPEEVSQIIKRMEAEAPRIKVTYKIGQKVRIIDGPFNDFIGTVDDIDMERAKVRVMVSFFGRETPVELDFLQVEKA